MERRFSSITLRALPGNRIGGTASVFYDGNPGTEFNLFGSAWERIDPLAFESVLRTNPDTVALFNHDPNQPLARVSNQTLKLWTDSAGLHYELQLPEGVSYAQDLYRNIESGLIKGSSFGAVVGFAQWHKEGDKDIRTIKRFKQLVDVSPVVFPAYGAASVQLRSADIAALQLEKDTYCRIEKARQLQESMSGLLA